MTFGRFGFGFGFTAGRGSPSAAALLAQRTLVIDLENSEFFWGGSPKTLGDLTTTANGYTLANAAWWNPSWTFLVEYEQTVASSETCAFALTGNPPAASITYRFELTTVTTSFLPRFYYNPPGQYYGQVVPQAPKYRTRVIGSITPGAFGRITVDGGSIVNAGTTQITGTPVFTGLSVGYRSGFNDLKFLGTVRKIYAWNRALSDNEIQTMAAYGPKPPVHAIGDSFLTATAGTFTAGTSFVVECKGLSTATYRMWSQDGVGGADLANHALRFAATPRYWKSTLLINDGGLSDDPSTIAASIDAMVSKLPHGRWLYLEPAYPLDCPTGSPNRIALDARVAAARAYCGSHFVDTKALMLAANDGSAQDLIDVANDVWPTSLHALGDNIHLNAHGHAVYAGIAMPALVAAGY